MSTLYYVTHPNVRVDPDVPVPDWSLSEVGRERANSMANQSWLGSVQRLISSTEQKALEMAAIVAEFTGLSIEERNGIGETDRSSTGFVPHEVHEDLADRFFAVPEESASGWERAIDAQQRIVAALDDVTTPGDEAVMVVGHGAVGTLLMSHLAGLAIDRQHDQPGQGHYWAYDRTTQQLLHRWHPIDTPPT